MSTQQRTFPTADATRRKAFYRPYEIECLGGGVWEVDPHASENTYTVMLRDGRFECDCESFNFHSIHGPRETCKHGRVVQGVVDGDLCPSCTYPRCRPSCRLRSDSL